jgi:hypothetical protein
MNKPAISKLNLTELISLSNQFDQKGMIKEADFCDKLASHIDKLGMARGVPDDMAKLKEEAQDLKVNIPTDKGKDANYTQLTDLIGENQNNRITMAAEELTRIPNFSVQKKGPKPSGIWYACGNEWISWLTYEMPQWIGDYVYSLKVDEGRILTIKTEDEFTAFEWKYLEKTEEGDFGRGPDWSLVARDYAGIEICPYRPEARMGSMWYYGWDVASGCVWEGSAVLEATLVAKRTKEIDRSDREDEWDIGRPQDDDESNWEWYGLGSGSVSTGSSRDPEEIAEEVAERVGEGEESGLDPTPQEPPSEKADPGRSGTYTSDQFKKLYPKPGDAKYAKRIKSLDDFRGDAALYELSEPLGGHMFVVVSASDVPMSGPETYIFGANENGEIQDWGELPGSTPGIMCHNTALKNAGYQIKQAR